MQSVRTSPTLEDHHHLVFRSANPTFAANVGLARAAVTCDENGGRQADVVLAVQTGTLKLHHVTHMR